ncbi:MAG: Rrf2 family transcriptional regulator [Treponema sp.]|jgi:Rrf2 family protein|nr:Rrf2 family transcriptional regulator [Treponema sp.]
MKISTRGRYGMRFLIDLAEHNGVLTTLADIAARQEISPRYLEQLSPLLKRAGFISSIKGSSGGYRLARPPSEIVIGDVLSVLEGDMLIADPPPANSESTIQRCLRAMVYDKLNALIADVINNKTLAQITEMSGQSPMYYI